jgi:DNA-binding NarL/FixJ family response regulator
MWRDGLSALLTAHSDLEVVGEADNGPILPRAMKFRPDIVLCDAGLAESAVADLQGMRDQGIDIRVIAFGLSAPPENLLKAFHADVAGIIPKNSPTDVLLNSIRKIPNGPASYQPRIPSEPPALNNPLSTRELQLVALVALGYRNREIADKLFISEQTVKNHLHNVFEKTGVRDRLELALYAVHRGLYD